MGSDFNFLCYPNNYTLNSIALRGKNGTNKKTKKLLKVYKWLF